MGIWEYCNNVTHLRCPAWSRHLSEAPGEPEEPSAWLQPAELSDPLTPTHLLGDVRCKLLNSTLKRSAKVNLLNLNEILTFKTP